MDLIIVTRYLLIITIIEALCAFLIAIIKNAEICRLKHEVENAQAMAKREIADSLMLAKLNLKLKNERIKYLESTLEAIKNGSGIDISPDESQKVIDRQLMLAKAEHGKLVEEFKKTGNLSLCFEMSKINDSIKLMEKMSRKEVPDGNQKYDG
jgi:hypothetical protein